jgi:hypothetical protein
MGPDGVPALHLLDGQGTQGRGGCQGGSMAPLIRVIGWTIAPC